MTELQFRLETAMRYVPVFVDMILSERDLSGLRYPKNDIVN